MIMSNMCHMVLILEMKKYCLTKKLLRVRFVVVSCATFSFPTISLFTVFLIYLISIITYNILPNEHPLEKEGQGFLKWNNLDLFSLDEVI